MRGIILGSVLLVSCVSSASAAPLGDVRGISVESLVNHVQRSDSRYCRRLRRACEFKEERGERGEGNCRRYRRECGRR
jgi:hypothetical protein